MNIEERSFEPLLEKENDTNSTNSDHSDNVSVTPSIIPDTKKAAKYAGKLVLMMEFFERICYYSISINLLLFCMVEIKIGVMNSLIIVLAFTGWTFFSSLFTNWIADAFLGKYNVILCSFILYICGSAIMLILGYFSDKIVTFRLGYFLIALILISFAAGIIKSNMSSFGAVQVVEYGDKATRTFFNCFYWLMNLASFISATVIAYFQIECFFYGYIPALCGVLIGTIIVLCGKSGFNRRKPNGSHFSDITSILKTAIHRKYKYYYFIKVDLPADSSLDLLEYAHVLFGGLYSTDQIDIVRSIGRVVLIFLTLIVYWAVYFQMPSVFLLQGQYFKLTIKDFRIPAASMCLFNSVSVLLFVQFMDFCVYPLCNRFNFNMTTLRRIGFGLLLSVLAMVTTALIEPHRRNHVSVHLVNTIRNTTFPASHYSIFWQGPQFVLIGFSEVLTSISGLEFAYSQTPKRYQGVILSLFLATSGIGAFLACIVVKVTSSYTNWMCENINKCHLEYYFYLLAGLSLVNFFVFVVISTKYSYVINTLPSTPTRSVRSITPYMTDDRFDELSSRVDLSRTVSPTKSLGSDIVVVS